MSLCYNCCKLSRDINVWMFTIWDDDCQLHVWYQQSLRSGRRVLSSHYRNQVHRVWLLPDGLLSRSGMGPVRTVVCWAVTSWTHLRLRYANSAQLAYYMNAHNFSVYLIKTCIYRRLNSLVFAGGRSRILLCHLFPHCDKLSVKPNNTQFCRVRSYTRALRCMAALHWNPSN